ncbi:MAG: amidohydrolase family protein, partial [Caldilineaceae bacterium]|nr:amidohydrolase family protein [Caldilineaceae bacterium]
MHIDLLLYNASQVVTCANPEGPKRGASLSDPGIIDGGAVAVSGGQIVAVGPSNELQANYTAAHAIDAAGMVICPGLVDAHTHLIFAGDRTAEFEQKLRGASYMEILAAGGGILSTMRATRAAPLEQLVHQARRRLDAMLRLGTTTVEIKTGYGLDTATELKLLHAIDALAATSLCDIAATFLGAHAVPPEYAGRTDDYVNLVVTKMLPAVTAWWQNSLLAN